MSKACSPSSLRRLIPLALALMVMTGCGQSGCTTSFNFKFGGPKKTWKVITRMENGVTRKLESTADVELQNGQITKFPPLAVIKLEESGSKQPRVAELRDNAGKLELWIKDNGSFRRSRPDEDIWLSGFLIEINK